MKRFFPASLLALLILFSPGLPAMGQSQSATHEELHSQAPESIYRNALDDWHDGRYPQALHAFRHLLEGSAAERWFEPIALKTGELYRVSQVSEDGTAIRFSADGHYAVYEKDGEEGGRTYLHDLDTGETAATVRGSGVQAAGNGSLVYRRLDENEAVRAAAIRRDSAISRARSTGDFDIWREAMSEYQAVERANTRLLRKAEMGSEERDITPGGFAVGDAVLSPDGGTIRFTGLAEGEDYSNIYELDVESGAVKELSRSRAFESGLRPAAAGRFLVFEYASQNPFRPDSGRRGEAVGWAGAYDLQTGGLFRAEGELEDVSREGERMLLSRESGGETTLLTSGLRVGAPAQAEILTTDRPITDAAISPGGSRVAYAIREQDDYEIYVHDADGSNRRRVTHEIQHDRFPTFLDENRLIAAKGEGRHRRSYLYDLEGGEPVKLFHNNTVRTIAPEYQWAVHPSGNNLLIVAERDGDTISPERGVYLLDLERRITLEDLKERVDRNLAAERALREKGRRTFSAIADEVRQVTSRASVRRIYKYEEDLYKFGSKYITQPGNDKAAEYIYNAYASFGYEPEYQWFNPGRGTFGGKTANVLARLEGTVNPELVYVVSSHYDSVEPGPGADDNTSGTAALLETARLLADNPLPFTVIFASFTGEEAGLLGSREFVRRAQEEEMQIVGALNNDMIGFANNSRLDNTIRYSNAGIRDIQHAAAFLFTELVTYDAHYYKFTDAHAYYDAYGDIVGGIGSYPVLGSPFYHQWNDNLETINHRLVAEVAKTTTATIMLLASSPSRLTGLAAEPAGDNGSARLLSWDPSPESDVRGYLVEYERADGVIDSLMVTGPEAVLEDLAPASEVRVKAVNKQGMESWDWARIVVE